MEHSVNMLETMSDTDQTKRSVSKIQYEQWRKAYIFDGIKGISYGQSFCRRFSIQDHILNRFDSGHRMDHYIRKHYV